MNEQLFQRYKNSSRIFHPERQGTDLGSLSTCKAELLELEGGEDGKIGSGRDLVLARIPQLKKELEDIQESFEQLKKQAKHEGRTLKEMPDYMKEDYEKAEARLMVHCLESLKLQERINGLEAQQVEKPDNDQVLKFGPKGMGKLRPTAEFPDGVLVEIDGQKLEYDGTGLVIQDERSVFNGMRLVDYKQHVMRPYRKELIRRKKICEELGRKNEPIPPEMKKPPKYKFWPEAVPLPSSETKKGTFKRKDKTS
jgi:hypothetical protein